MKDLKTSEFRPAAPALFKDFVRLRLPSQARQPAQPVPSLYRRLRQWIGRMSRGR